MDPNNLFMNCYFRQGDTNNPNNLNPFITFSNWYPHKPFFNQHSPTFENVSESQPKPEVEVAPETQDDPQPATSRRRHRRKEVPEKTSKPTIIRWSEVEKVALARAYIDVSENSFVAIDCDSYRTNDMISGKWCNLQREVSKFNGVWIQHHNNRKSGENDETVMN
ncbi:hypothetical protein R6Q59_019461 [Mikania micrantha]